jgi:hypothetical protein
VGSLASAVTHKGGWSFEMTGEEAPYLQILKQHANQVSEAGHLELI